MLVDDAVCIGRCCDLLEKEYLEINGGEANQNGVELSKMLRHSLYPRSSYPAL